MPLSYIWFNTASVKSVTEGPSWASSAEGINALFVQLQVKRNTSLLPPDAPECITVYELYLTPEGKSHNPWNSVIIPVYSNDDVIERLIAQVESRELCFGTFSCDCKQAARWLQDHSSLDADESLAEVKDTASALGYSHIFFQRHGSTIAIRKEHGPLVFVQDTALVSALKSVMAKFRGSAM